MLRHDDQVPDAPRYLTLATGARIRLDCLIWLNDVDDYGVHRSTQEGPEHDSENEAQEDGHDQHIQS